MSRTICVATGTRAEYGLLRRLIMGLRAGPEVRLQVIATGTHLSPEHGFTIREIDRDGVRVDRRIEMTLALDTPAGVATSMGVAIAGFGRAFEALQPDLLVLLGDRFEALAAASAALVARVPIAHLHGGELTGGAFDESIRHAITKMSHLHFVAAEEYRRRVIQLGEDPARVFLVGGFGVDAIYHTPVVARDALESELGFTFGSRSLVVTFHPATLESESPVAQVRELFAALDDHPDVNLLFTMPNADPAGVEIAAEIRTYVGARANARAFESLGLQRYLSSLRHSGGVIGNSSSGLLEAPTLHKASINIGDRQQGRLRATSVIDCAPRRESITAAITRVFSDDFQRALPATQNPYGPPGASDRTLEVLRTTPLDGLLRKEFRDLDDVRGRVTEEPHR